MAKYRKRPVVIEAVQFTEDMVRANVFYGRALPEGVYLTRAQWHEDRRLISWRAGIKTLEGVMEVSDGDWIITGVKGERYPCKPDIFEQTYEPAE